jgi:hypothetical protein
MDPVDLLKASTAYILLSQDSNREFGLQDLVSGEVPDVIIQGTKEEVNLINSIRRGAIYLRLFIFTYQGFWRL